MTELPMTCEIVSPQKSSAPFLSFNNVRAPVSYGNERMRRSRGGKVEWKLSGYDNDECCTKECTQIVD